MARQGSSQRHRAEHLAATLPPLMVAAERVASTVAQGVHGRRRVGTGETFWQFRQYQIGDQASDIDWRQSAKSDRVFVREHEWEAAQSVWVWCDASPSMHYSSDPALPTKHDRAAILALATSVLLVQGGEYVGLMGSDFPPATGRAALNRVAAELEAVPSAQSGSLPPHVRLPRAADILLISDFLTPFAEIEAHMRGLAAEGVTGTLMQVLDPVELDPPFTGHVRFEGLEGEADFTAGRADRLRQPYRTKIAARRDALATLARQLGWMSLTHATDHAPEAALLALYLALAERHQQSQSQAG